MTTPLLYPALATHRGQRRRNNEDYVGYAYPDDPVLLAKYGAVFVVSDGVGGLAHGETYSEQVVSLITDMYYQSSGKQVAERLARVIQQINLLLHKTGGGGAATIVVGVFHGSSLTIANAGDSRAYLMNRERSLRLTDDHVVIVEEDGRHSKKLFRAVGYESLISVDTVTGLVHPGQRLLLCTDGVTRYLTDDNLFDLAATHAPSDVVNRLVQLAYAAGGVDNISAALIEVGDFPTNNAQLQQHVSRLQPILTLPDTLAAHPILETLPPYPPPVAQFPVDDTSTILYDRQRKTFHAQPFKDVEIAPERPLPEDFTGDTRPPAQRPAGLGGRLGNFIQKVIGKGEDPLAPPTTEVLDRHLAATAPLMLETDAGETNHPELIITKLMDEEGDIYSPTRPRIVAYLRLESATNQIFPVEYSGAVIGRKDTCTVVIMGDKAVSGEHARLTVQPETGEVILTVLSQTNPVIIGQTILRHGERHQLHFDDVIQLSPITRLLFMQPPD